MLFRKSDVGLYNAIRTIYYESTCAVRVNDCMTDWFKAEQGVKQGDNLSPLLFSVYVNSLIGDLKSAEVGVSVGTDVVSVLAYADDLVLLAENELDLQKLLDVLHNGHG